jgi:hypothetical protein
VAELLAQLRALVEDPRSRVADRRADPTRLAERLSGLRDRLDDVVAAGGLIAALAEAVGIAWPSITG